MTKHFLLAAGLVLLASTQTSCTLANRHLHRASNLLLSPARAVFWIVPGHPVVESPREPVLEEPAGDVRP